MACAALLLAVAAVYHGVGQHRFVNFDDPMYLYENSHVTAGLTGGGLAWAWTNKDALQWHPLVWMAHLLVSGLAGMQPGPHLLVNVAVHALNAGLLFLWLRLLTAAPGRSFVVALLFAVHPVNVETAAWASQLKSTLSTAFFLLALLAYTRHAQRRAGGTSVAALVALILSLLTKPMMVSFPLLLVLLDFWPLRRLPPTAAEWGRWLWPKLPFVLVAAVVAIVAALPWGAHPEMATVHGLEWPRVAALPWNYVRYLGLFFWPADLAVLYPENLHHPLLAEAGALLVLVAISGVAWTTRRQQPALLVGWGWFLLTLLPVSGIVQLGPQGLADRYLYVPGMGLLFAAVWVTADALAGQGRVWRFAFAGAVAVGWAWGAQAQVKYWENSVTLWQHAAAVTPPSSAGHVNLGNALMVAGRADEATAEFNAAIRLQQNDPRPYVNLAVLAERRGDVAGAIVTLRQALVLAPTDARILSNLGSLLQDAGQPGEARQLLERAIALRPDLPEAQINLGVLLAQSGELSRALACFEAADRLRPGDAAVQQNLRLVRQQLAAPKPEHPPGV